MVFQSSSPSISKPPRLTPTKEAGESGGISSLPPRPAKPTKAKSLIKGSIIIILVLIIVLGVLYLIGNYTNVSVPFFTKQLSNKWQAVFLDNGQVYFGKIMKVKSDSIVLREVYYLQVITEPLQRSQEPGFQPVPQQEQRLTLIKLGNEIHGPSDEMIINRSHIVLTEDLKDDSRVVQAINRYLQEQQSQK